MSKIASWQMQHDKTSYQNGNIQLFHFALRADILRAMIHHAESLYGDNGDGVWLTFINTLRAELRSGTLSIGGIHSPCKEYDRLWVFKTEALMELYNLVYGLYIQFSFDPFQLEVYREKTEQAIDYLSDRTNAHRSPSDFPFLEVDSLVFDVTMDEAARNILKRRSEWIKRMTHIETIKIPVKRSILCHQNDISETSNAIAYGSTKLKECYETWI